MASLTLPRLAPPRQIRRIRGLPRARELLLAAASALALLEMTFTPALAAGTQTYRIQPGDTLSGIAARYGVSVSDLVTLNGIVDPSFVLAGQTLRIGHASTASSAARGDSVKVLWAPYYRQFDGSIYAESNCGPTSLAMALGALNISAGPLTLRHLASRAMGFDNPYGGVTWEALAYAARVKGASVLGLYNGNRYRIWSVDALRQEFAQGHPVILLVRYRALPDHRTSSFWGDHYIVGLGFDAAGNLVYNDPAFHVGSGANRTISRTQLLSAWSSTAVGLIRTAMALAR